MKIREAKIALAHDSFSGWFSHLSESKIEPVDFSSEVDVVIFTGGIDISPKLYGEEPDLCRYWSDTRDAAEIAVLDAIYKTKVIAPKFVIGCCRGLQILNAYFGGTLYQDLQKLKHGMYHSIKYVADVGVLSNMTLVNSLHHQAVKDLAPEAEIKAIEPGTGVVEMVKFGAEIPTWGTQFHPEAFSYGKSITFFNLLLQEMEAQK